MVTSTFFHHWEKRVDQEEYIDAVKRDFFIGGIKYEFSLADFIETNFWTKFKSKPPAICRENYWKVLTSSDNFGKFLGLRNLSHKLK